MRGGIIGKKQVLCLLEDMTTLIYTITSQWDDLETLPDKRVIEIQHCIEHTIENINGEIILHKS